MSAQSTTLNHDSWCCIEGSPIKTAAAGLALPSIPIQAGGLLPTPELSLNILSEAGLVPID